MIFFFPSGLARTRARPEGKKKLGWVGFTQGGDRWRDLALGYYQAAPPGARLPGELLFD